MKKLFISQPMNGKSKEEILRDREKAVLEAKAIFGNDVEVIDTFYTDFPEGTKPIEYLARSITDLAKADIAYFAEGWEDARGCKIEKQCVVGYGIDYVDYTEERR